LFFFSSRRRHTRFSRDWSSDVCSSDLSITKVFTAAAILMLIEDGRLYLQQSVADWLPPFDTPLHRPINLWHLLTHTSGLMPDPRSEERRVGKERRSRRRADQEQNKRGR